MNKIDGIVYGGVSTRKINSETTFEICLKSEWEKMTEDERYSALIEAMWDSGAIDVYPVSGDE